MEGTQNGEGKSYLQSSKPDQVENGARSGTEGENLDGELTHDHKLLDRAAYEAIVAEDEGDKSVLAEMLSGSRSQYDEILEETQTTETESDSLTHTNTDTGSLENGAPDGKKGYLAVLYCTPHLADSDFINSMDVIFGIYFFSFCVFLSLCHFFSTFSIEIQLMSYLFNSFVFVENIFVNQLSLFLCCHHWLTLVCPEINVYALLCMDLFQVKSGIESTEQK